SHYEGPMNRILLLIRNKRNRQALETTLTENYDLIPENIEQPLQSEFDLAIVDGPMLKRLCSKVRKRREAEEPVFLPFLLLTVRRSGSIPVRNLGRMVDDVIVKPIRRDELRARVDNLLRRRK